MHLDGARIWNALTATGQQPFEMSQHVDSLSVCLSKGLGAPIGSVLIGPQHIVDKARRIRKALGGGMRQVGVLGAAGLQALDDFERGVLADDHRRASMLADGIKPYVELDPARVETNIVFVKVEHPQRTCRALKDAGVLASAWSPRHVRLVVHRDITDDDVRRAIEAFRCIAS